MSSLAADFDFKGRIWPGGRNFSPHILDKYYFYIFTSLFSAAKNTYNELSLLKKSN